MPFSGLGRTLKEKGTIIAVRFATVRLAVQSHLLEHGTMDEAQMVTIVQSLARFMDHLADPELSMNLYKDAGWDALNRIMSVVGAEKDE